MINNLKETKQNNYFHEKKEYKKCKQTAFKSLCSYKSLIVNKAFCSTPIRAQAVKYN